LFGLTFCSSRGFSSPAWPLKGPSRSSRLSVLTPPEDVLAWSLAIDAHGHVLLFLPPFDRPALLVRPAGKTVFSFSSFFWAFAAMGFFLFSCPATTGAFFSPRAYPIPPFPLSALLGDSPSAEPVLYLSLFFYSPVRRHRPSFLKNLSAIHWLCQPGGRVVHRGELRHWFFKRPLTRRQTFAGGIENSLPL